MLDIDDEVGSLRAGKRADMTVLSASPYEVGASGLRELEVLATVFEGRVHEIGPSVFLPA